MAPPIERLYDLAVSALAVIETYWDAGAEALPERAYVHAGDVAIDCEQLVVAITGTVGTSSDLSQAGLIEQNQASPLWVMRAATIAISLSRCAAPMVEMGDNVAPPTEGALTADALTIATDAQAMLNALVEGQKAGELAGCNGLVFSTWNVDGPAGGFVTGTLTINALLLGGAVAPS